MPSEPNITGIIHRLKNQANNTENIKISFYAGNIMLSGIYGNKIGFYYAGFSLGLMGVNYSYVRDNKTYETKSTTLGISANPGIDFLITKKITVGFSASFLYGKFGSLKDINGNYLLNSPSINGTHIDVMASVKFIL